MFTTGNNKCLNSSIFYRKFVLCIQFYNTDPPSMRPQGKKPISSLTQYNFILIGTLSYTSCIVLVYGFIKIYIYSSGCHIFTFIIYGFPIKNYKLYKLFVF